MRKMATSTRSPPPGGSTRTVRFGVRDFRAEGGVLTLNGRRIFLRSEANCAVFPEEGHPPMTVERWREVLAVYRSYGVNCMRFHSHIPPEAAFAAADEMGMLMQPELSHWNPETALNPRKASLTIPENCARPSAFWPITPPL